MRAGVAFGWLRGAVVALVVAMCVASPAFGADSVYWSESTNPGSIRVANLDGTGTASNLFAGENEPEGVAIDPAAGKIYWADDGSDVIRVGNLDGSGVATNLFTGQDIPEGVAIDAAAGKIYWANYASSAIVVANLDGSGTATALFSGEAAYEAVGVAVDPAAGKIYWTSSGSGSIWVGNLDGTGTPVELFSGEDNPRGVAIDPAVGNIYWSDAGSGAIRVGNLGGSGMAASLFTGEDVPGGVAIDPAAGNIYWVADGSGKVRVANLGGGGTPANLFGGESAPEFVALLDSPEGTAVPAISGGGLGAQLACNVGSWAPDSEGAFLYQAPRSFSYQWQRNGAAVNGANQASYAANEPGVYACLVTASNQAGSSTQTSAAVTISAPPPPLPAPIVTRVAQSHPTWVLGNKLATEARHRPSVGTTFSFTLNEPARVTFAFTEREGGRRVKGKCIAQTKQNRHEPSCTHTVTQGTLTFTAHTGNNKVPFQGRISTSRKLKVGRYTLMISATNTAGRRSKQVSLNFTIVK
jgi:PQQ-like domain